MYALRALTTPTLAQKLQAALAATRQAGLLDQDITLDIDVGKSDGSFLNELLEWEFASAYANTTNVVARLSPVSAKEKGEQAQKEKRMMVGLVLRPIVATAISLSFIVI